ncbi:MAG: hypothetical protein ACLRQX_09120 [Turicibacter sanguinis]
MKASRWLERGTEPQWLKDDMRKYYKLKLANESVKTGRAVIRMLYNTKKSTSVGSTHAQGD